MSKLIDIRLSVANSLSKYLDNDYYIFAEMLRCNNYRVVWLNQNNKHVVLGSVNDISDKQAAIKTIIY